MCLSIILYYCNYTKRPPPPLSPSHLPPPLPPYFDVLHGTKQGDNLSPTLFNLFINNLASQIKELHCGIKIGIEQVSILLYADDIVLLSDSEKSLQSMLTYLNKWCMQWCLDIYVLKSNIIHFRPKKVPISQFVFKCGTHVIKTIDRYTYLGVMLDEHITFSFYIDARYTSGSKSLSSIICKYNVYASSSSCDQTSVFHLSTHFFAVSLNWLRSSNEQGYARRVHCIMCAVFSVARPHSQVVSPS